LQVVVGSKVGGRHILSISSSGGCCCSYRRHCKTGKPDREKKPKTHVDFLVFENDVESIEEHPGCRGGFGFLWKRTPV
jgi:uncharacterized protein (DUF2147 family)